MRFDRATGSITFPDGTTERATGTFEWAVVASPANPDVIRKSAQARAAKGRATIEEIKAALETMIITVSTAAGPLEEGPVFRARLEPTNVEVIIDSRDEVLDHDLTRGQPFRWAATGRNLKDGLRQQAARRIVKLEEVVASAQESAEATLGKEDHRLLWQVVRWTNSEHSAIKFLGRLNHDDATGRKFSVVAGE